MFKDFQRQLYPAPGVFEEFGPNESELEELLSQEVANADLYFAVANRFLRGGDAKKAASVFEKLLLLDPELAKARTNFAVALLELGRIDKAIVELQKAVLADPSLINAHVLLGKALCAESRLEEAGNILKRAVDIDSSHAEAYAFLGCVSEDRGELGQAVTYFERALGLSPDCEELKQKLGALSFRKGERLFLDQREDEAFSIWGEARIRYGPVVWGDKNTADSMRRLIKGYEDDGMLEKAFDSFRQNPTDPVLVYSFFCRFLFTVELIDECYEDYASLSEAEARWQEQADEEGERPYPSYRLALVYVYQGRLLEALSQLKYCEDICPQKKRHVIKLKEITEFVRKLRDIQQRVFENQPSDAAEDEWKRHGFGNPFEVAAWKRTGISPEKSAQWKEAGFTAGQARAWGGAKLEPAQSKQWRDEGFREPGAISLWIRGDFTPAEAKDWEEVFGKNVELAVQSRKAGFEDAKLAWRWVSLFCLPIEAVPWVELGFSPEEAALWLRMGVKDPYLANKRKEEAVEEKEEEGEGEESEEEPM